MIKLLRFSFSYICSKKIFDQLENRKEIIKTEIIKILKNIK